MDVEFGENRSGMPSLAGSRASHPPLPVFHLYYQVKQVEQVRMTGARQSWVKFGRDAMSP
jgi:hypothetical protein